jgi:thiamine biosynthesis lipoprotein ApbE
MDPRTGRPVHGILSVAVLSETAVAGDALDDAFFVLGPEGSRSYLRTLSGVEAMFFMPNGAAEWKVIRRNGGPQQ